MNTRWLSRIASVMAAVGLPAAVSAQITIAVGAQEEAAWNDEVTFGAGVNRAWGRAGAVFGSAGGQIEAGVQLCEVIDCGPFVTLPGASGAARADATQMNVGVRGYGASAPWSTEGFGEVSVRDTLLIAAPAVLAFDIRLDLGLAASEDAIARYSFGIALGSGDGRRVEFGFLASEQSGVRTAEVFLDNGATSFALPSVPDTFEYILNVPVLPGSVPIEVSAGAYAESGSAEFASVSAFNSAWLGIGGDYSSLNGYGYPGFAAAIPEPDQAALLAAGLAIVLIARSRRCIASRQAMRRP